MISIPGITIYNIIESSTFFSLPTMIYLSLVYPSHLVFCHTYTHTHTLAVLYIFISPCLHRSLYLLRVKDRSRRKTHKIIFNVLVLTTMYSFFSSSPLLLIYISFIFSSLSPFYVYSCSHFIQFISQKLNVNFFFLFWNSSHST